MNFSDSFDRLIGNEGGYSNHPDDPGGETMWGVTKRVALENGYIGPMRDMPKARAQAIYRAKYWDAVQADKLPESLRFEVFDAAVNSGPAQAVRWLQQAVGAMPDGKLGPMTLQAATLADALAPARFNGIRLEFMAGLSTWSSFGKGWARRVAGNLQMLKG